MLTRSKSGDVQLVRALAIGVLLCAGCGEATSVDDTYGRRRGTPGEASVNGTAVLARMFEEAGHTMSLYDPLYVPDQAALRHQYDFITASEVVEHLHQPAVELERLWSTLKPGGWLGIMTKLALDREAFSKWHYKNDLTHVCFFSEETMEWLADQWGTSYELIGRDVVLFQKPSG